MVSFAPGNQHAPWLHIPRRTAYSRCVNLVSASAPTSHASAAQMGNRAQGTVCSGATILRTLSEPPWALGERAGLRVHAWSVAPATQPRRPKLADNSPTLCRLFADSLPTLCRQIADSCGRFPGEFDHGGSEPTIRERTSKCSKRRAPVTLLRPSGCGA